MYSMVNFPDIL